MTFIGHKAIQELRKLAAEATPGPWMTPAETGDKIARANPTRNDDRWPVDHEGCQVWPWQSEADMRLAYWLRNNLEPILLALIAAEG